MKTETARTPLPDKMVLPRPNGGWRKLGVSNVITIIFGPEIGHNSLYGIARKMAETLTEPARTDRPRPQGPAPNTKIQFGSTGCSFRDNAVEFFWAPEDNPDLAERVINETCKEYEVAQILFGKTSYFVDKSRNPSLASCENRT